MSSRKRAGAAIAAAALATVALAVAASEHQEPTLPADLTDYEHINTLVVPDAESPIHGIHHFYMGPTGRQEFRAGGTDEYPDGTTIVGKVFAPVKTDDGRYMEGDLVAYTMMKKDAGAQATAATGGWHFTMHEPGGEAKGVDPAQACFGCHQPSPRTDFVLSTPLAPRE